MDREITKSRTKSEKGPLALMKDWRGAGIRGELVYWPDMASAYLGLKRHVEIWLPPGYRKAGESRYKTLYMQDGQNLFDPRLALTGTDWGVDETVTRLADKGVMEPVIVVGVWSTDERGREYSPWHGAPRYARFLIEELMPRVHAEFRTLTGPENTSVMGASMGGLMAFYLATHHPEVFGACGCLSTHFTLSEDMMASWFPDGKAPETPDKTPYILRDIKKGLKTPESVRYWFDYGTLGLDASYGPAHKAVHKWLLGQGRKEGADFIMRAYEGADHNEPHWRVRLEDPLTFIFGKKGR